MATKIRPKISEKNRYFVSKHRYYELKHFCLQYNEWKENLYSLDGFLPGTIAKIGTHGVKKSSVEAFGEARLYFSDRIDMVERCAKEAAGEWWKALLYSITNEISYDCLNAKIDILLSKDSWYLMYRKFFWILDKERK